MGLNVESQFKHTALQEDIDFLYIATKLIARLSRTSGEQTIQRTEDIGMAPLKLSLLAER